MESYLGSLLIMASMVSYSSATVSCTQPLEVWSHHHHKLLLRKYICDQEVHSTDLQMEPEIFYDGHLPQNYTYTLFLLENNNNNTGSYKIRWIITDIMPVNKSLTANKTIVAGYKPPTNNMNTTDTVLLYKHLYSLNMSSPSHTEMHNFIPRSWAAPIQNISLENNATFHVLGKNTSHPHPSVPFHPHISTETHTSPTQTTIFNTTTPPNITPYATQMITEKKPGYHSYNTTKNNTINNNSPSHTHKNGAISNVSTLTVLFIPLILVITKVIY